MDANGSGALSPRRALAAAQGKEKLDILLEAPDPEALVQSIPDQELYLALLEIGPEDAAEVVALSSPSQFRHAIDLAAWPGGDAGPEAAAILRWLRLAREGAGHSDRARRKPARTGAGGAVRRGAPSSRGRYRLRFQRRPRRQRGPRGRLRGVARHPRGRAFHLVSGARDPLRRRHPRRGAGARRTPR